MSTLELDVELKKGETFFIHASDCPRGIRTPWGVADSDAVKSGERKGPGFHEESEKKLVGELLRVRQLRIEGPLLDQWPHPLSWQLLDDSGRLSDSGIQDLLDRAFRRPTEPNVVSLYKQIFDATLSQGLTSEEGLRQVIEAVLCSPRFLYVRPPGDEEDCYAIANRLSYLLWNSMPDETLFQAAKAGEIHDRSALDSQVRRMIADPKSDRFVVDFAGQWLGLRRVGAMLPDPKLFPDYDPSLESAMRMESEALFAEILHANLPITDFLHPSFVMLNERLARHYGIDGVSGPDFRRVEVPATHPRGGLLGHASMLTVTSNGTRTSPVVRGVWVLESLLDSPPSPPPPDVEPIEPDVRGATTIREMLAQHRDVATCKECHRRIDPWGFGLENFDAVGAWRDRYGRDGKGKPVDASGKTPNGTPFDGVLEMRSALLRQSDRFAHAIASKVFAHAVGRPPTARDRIAIDDVVRRNQKSGGRFADMLVELCVSQPFLNREIP
ncbi:MAG: DUF1592 domain-containing protein, partial [Planctomycetota bacterium]